MNARAYLSAQGRRALRLLPHMLLLTLLMASVGLLAGQMIVQRSDEDAEQHTTYVGLVADPDMPGLMPIVNALKNYSAARYALDVTVMNEDEAQQRLRAMELNAYIVVPDDFAESLQSGEVHPLRYVTLSGVSGTTALLASELTRSISVVLLEMQGALSGMRDYIAAELPEEDSAARSRELSDRYFALLLARGRFYRLETLGVAASLSTESYYLCGIGTLFLMLWCISCSPFFSRRTDELCRMLTLRGVGARRQVLCEFAPFFGLMLVGLLIVAGAAALFFPVYGAAMPPLELLTAPEALPVFLCQLLMLCAMSFFLYELENAEVGGILLQFFSAVAQGYVCGCFYPYSFFPRPMQTLGAALPAGIALRAIEALLSGAKASLLPAAGYAILFLCLSALLRRRRLSR